jgi:hypothetical protein
MSSHRLVGDLGWQYKYSIYNLERTGRQEPSTGRDQHETIGPTGAGDP